MDPERLRLLRERIHASLTSHRSRETMVFLFFLLVSTGFWLLQTLNDSYETVIRLPLRLNNVPQGTVITTDLPSAVAINIHDKGTTLLGYYFRLRKDSVVVDFSLYDNGETNGHVVLSHSDVLKQLSSTFETSSRIVSVRPDTLEYYYTRGVRKRIPVEFHGRIEVSPFYFLSEVRCEPDSIDVWAEQSLLDTITVMPTVNTVWTELTETTVQNVPLLARRGMKLEPAAVRLSAIVDVYVEKQVQVPIIGTNFPAGYVLRTFPPTATLSFRVGSMRFKEVTADNFVLTATYEELLHLPDSILHLQLRSVPEGVSQVRISPPDVQFMIEMNDPEEE
ncbi:MAG: YbbR-like domain-containing protein [Bacteroidaceae bacterium]|nr:YbbR-like domain-containing protein [Bacteroidaceae bacterium]